MPVARWRPASPRCVSWTIRDWRLSGVLRVKSEGNTRMPSASPAGAAAEQQAKIDERMKALRMLVQVALREERARIGGVRSLGVLQHRDD